MSTFETPHLDRDPRTGHLLPGHSISNKDNKFIAQKMAELKRKYMECVKPTDSQLVYEAHMACITQTKDLKLTLAAISLWYDRNFGKAVETINMDVSKSDTSPLLNLTPEQAVAAAQLLKQLHDSRKPVDDVVDAEIIPGRVVEPQ